MKTAEEILKQYALNKERYLQIDYRADDVILAMKEYAAQVAHHAIKEAGVKIQESLPLNEMQSYDFNRLIDTIEQSVISTKILTP